MVYGIISIHILAKANCALLPVKEFKITIIVNNPIHNIKRKVFPHRTNDFITLFGFVDKFTLKSRANIQASFVTDNAIFRIVNVTLDNVFYGDFV